MAISSPLDLPNLLAWYTADSQVYVDAGSTLATNTQTVQQWNDKSGNGYHLKQATSGKRPQYLSAGFNGFSTIKFTNSSSTGLITSGVVVLGTGSSASMFFVGQMLTGTPSYGRVLAVAPAAASDQDGTARLMARFDTTNVVTCSPSYPSASISLATNYRIGVISDGVNQTIYVNNTSAAANANAATLPGGSGNYIAVGTEISAAGGTLGTADWDGPVSEVVITQGALTSTERTDLDDYFVSHWISPPTSTQPPRSMQQFRQRAG